MVVLHAVVFSAGLLLVLRALPSAIRTFAVPRGAHDQISSRRARIS